MFIKSGNLMSEIKKNSAFFSWQRYSMKLKSRTNISVSGNVKFKIIFMILQEIVKFVLFSIISKGGRARFLTELNTCGSFCMNNIYIFRVFPRFWSRKYAVSRRNALRMYFIFRAIRVIFSANIFLVSLYTSHALIE